MTNNKPMKVNLFVWKGEKYCTDIASVKVNYLSTTIRSKISPELQARDIARFIMYGAQGNTLDVLFHAIANEIRESEEWIHSPEYIENKIRCALNVLANVEES